MRITVISNWHYLQRRRFEIEPVEKAQRLSAAGAKVIVTGRNPETLASAKKILSDAVVIRSDSGDLAAAQALGEGVKTFADHLDGAFLNAGVGTFQPIEAASRAETMVFVADDQGIVVGLGHQADALALGPREGPTQVLSRL